MWHYFVTEERERERERGRERERERERERLTLLNYSSTCGIMRKQFLSLFRAQDKQYFQSVLDLPQSCVSCGPMWFASPGRFYVKPQNMHFALESWLVLISFASKMLDCLVLWSYIFGSLLYYVPWEIHVEKPAWIRTGEWIHSVGSLLCRRWFDLVMTLSRRWHAMLQRCWSGLITGKISRMPFLWI